MTKQLTKRALSWLLTLCMLLSMVPLSALAATVSYTLVTDVSEDAAQWTTDETTKGNWVGTYGTDGYVLCAWDNSGDISKLPYYIDSVEYFAQKRFGGYIGRSASTKSTSNSAWWDYGLAAASDPDGTRKIAYRYDDGGLVVRINANDKQEHLLSFYCVAENDPGRQQTVQVFDPDTGEALSQTVTMDDLTKGEYITVAFAGSVDVWFNNDAYDPPRTNVVINGIFFDSEYEGGNIPMGKLFIAPEDGEIVRTKTGTVQMSFTTLPVNATDRDVAWSIVSGADVASVDENGLVTIAKEGRFTVQGASKTDPDITDQIELVCISSPETPSETSISHIGDSHVIFQNALVKILVDLESGYYSIYDQKNGDAIVLNAYFQVNEEKSIDGYRLTAKELTSDDTGMTMRLTGVKEGMNDLVLDIRLDHDTGDILFQAGLTNHSGTGVKVMQMYPIVANYKEKGGIFLGPNPAKNHALLTGDAMYNTAQVKQGVSTSSRNNLMITYRDNPNLESFLIGQLTTYSFQGMITSSYDADAVFTNNGRKSFDLNFRIYDNTGKLVDGGSTYVGDTMLINFTTDNPYDSLDEYAERQAQTTGVDLIDFDPYIYECLWYVNWSTENANNADFAVQEVRDLYERGLANYAIPNIRVEGDTYVNPNEQLWWDDAHWLSFGHLTDTYPTTAQWIAAMKEAGGEGGIYMQASYRSNDYCELYPGHMVGNISTGGPDYTDPEFEAHMAEVYARLKADGVRSIFYDYAGQYKGGGVSYLLDLTGGFEDEYATAVEAYRKIYEFPKKYIGSDVRITENSIEYTGNDLAIGLIDIQRCVLDTNKFTPAIAANGINQWYRHRTTKLIYADTKVFENTNVDLRRAQITGTGFFFGKTTLGESVNLMSDEKIQDIGKIVPFPVDGIAARPVGLFEGDYETNPYVYDYEFDSEYDDHILLFWNQEVNGEMEISANLGEDTAFGGVGLDADKEYEVWDFWNWEYIGRVKGSDILTQSVRKNEMRTMAVREVREEPYLLSTNRHVLQGTEQVDVKAFEYDADTNTVTGTFDIVGNDTYKAIISLSDNALVVDSFQIDNDAVTGKAEMIVEDNNIQITLDAEENQTVPFTLKLKEGSVDDDHTPPADVTNLKATADDYEGIVTLTWDESTDDNVFVQVKYEIYGSTEPEFELSDATLLAATTDTTFTDSVNRGTFYYQVMARDGAGNASLPAKIATSVQLAENSSGITMTAGDSYYSQVAGNTIDGKTNTIWHTNWNGTARENMWLDMKFAAPTAINTYAYLPRNDASTNGTITKYQILGSTDGGKTYTIITEGDWPNQIGWKVAEFDTVTVTNIRLIAVESVGEYASAAEVKVYKAAELDGVGINPSQITMKVGETRTVTGFTSPTNAGPYEIKYISSDASIATVDEKGIVTAHAPGEVDITASVAPGGGICHITVEPIEATAITLDKAEVELVVGEELTLTAAVFPEGATAPAVSWSSSDASVATVADGKITAVGAGEATITVTSADGKRASCTVTVTEPKIENPFIDVTQDDYFYDATLWAVGKGITVGDGAENTFNPEGECIRAQVVTFLWRAAGEPEPSSTENPFKDITETDYYYKAVLWAVEKGITVGIETDAFGPEQACTRAQVAAFLYRYDGEKQITIINPFRDVNESEYYYNPVMWAVYHGITQGDGEPDTFNPDGTCTRAQIVTFLYRYMVN